jgi:outer membrane protein assembly factor BamB
MASSKTVAPPSLVAWEDGAHTLVATQGEALVALSARDGKVLTRYRAGGALVGRPAQRGGSLYVCFRSRDPKVACTVQALRMDGGGISSSWSYTAGGRLSAPVAAEDTVYVIGGDRLHALRSSDGELLWTSQVETALLGTPAVADGVVYAVATANAAGQPAAAYALHASSGSLLWRATLPESPTPSRPVVVAGKTCYVPDLQGCCALSAESGDFLWKREIAVAVHGQAIISGDVVYFSFSALDLSSREDFGVSPVPGGSSGRHIHLVSLRRDDGATLWQQRMGAGTEATFVTAPAVLPGEHAVVIGTNDGTVYALRQDDGSLLWRCGTSQRQKLAAEGEEQTLEAESAADGKILAVPIAIGKVVYTGANDGFVYALSARTGVPLWRTFIGVEAITTFAYAPLASLQP